MVVGRRTFDVSYSSASIELFPRDSVLGMPAAPVRLTVSHHVPLAVMACTALIYWFLLVPHVFPALWPTSESSRAVWGRMRNRWNAFLFTFSAFCCGTAIVMLWQDGQLFRRGAWEALHCRTVEGTRLRAVSTLFTISKLWEWGDTLFLVALGSKPPEFLHLYHHATTFWLFCFVMKACLESPDRAMPAGTELRLRTNTRTSTNGGKVPDTNWPNKGEFEFSFWASRTPPTPPRPWTRATPIWPRPAH